MIGAEGVMVKADGLGLTVTVAVPVTVHPAFGPEVLSVAVTEYICVVKGDTVWAAPFKEPGLHT